MRFDAASYLGNPSAQAEYIIAARETGDPAFIRDAHKVVRRARKETCRETGNPAKDVPQTKRGGQ
jgi:DNA-binding phage protein